MPTEQLSPHFTLAEFTLSTTAAQMGLDNTPPPDAHANLAKLAGVLERVRVLLGGKPILISSGYRSPQVNAAVGGVSNSAHLTGLACDFTAPGAGTPKDICRVLEPHMADLGIDQLIYEFSSWVHLGLSLGAPRQMALTIDNWGTTTGFA